MQVHGSTEQERLQDVSLDLHHDDDAGEHDQGLHPADRHQGDEHGEEPGHEGADERDERAQEHQGGQGRSQRDAQGQGHDQHADGVDQGHQHRRADVRRQRLPAAQSGGVGPGLSPPRHQVEQEAEDAAAVVEEVEQREQADRDPGQEVPDAGADVAGVGGDGALAVDQELLDAGAPLVQPEPALVDRQRAVHQPLLELSEPGHHLLAQLARLAGDRVDDQRQGSGDEQDPAEQGEGRGRSLRQPPPVQPVGQRLQRGGQQARDGERDDDLGQEAEDPADEVDQAGHQEDPPRPGGGDLEGGGDGLVGLGGGRRDPDLRRDLGRRLALEQASTRGGLARGGRFGQIARFFELLLGGDLALPGAQSLPDLLPQLHRVLLLPGGWPATCQR